MRTNLGEKTSFVPPFFFPCCVLTYYDPDFLIGCPVLGHNWDLAPPVLDTLLKTLFAFKTCENISNGGTKKRIVHFVADTKIETK